VLVAGEVVLALKRKAGTEDVPLPAYASVGASGLDLSAAVEGEVTVAPGQIVLIPTGLYVAVPPGYEAQIRARSGLALRHGLVIVNAPGTIDSDYRGEVGLIVGNIGPRPFTVCRGQRIAQMVIQPVTRVRVEVREELDATARGAGGFGHTGV
jgi:dUTP pyrophosphatase